MFNANEIITALKGLLDSQLSPALKVQVEFDTYRTFDKEAFADGSSYVVVTAGSDSPVNSEEGFESGHYRTLSIRFEIRTLGFPTHLTVEPIAKAVADIVYQEQRKLQVGTSTLQSLVIGFGLPVLSYEGMQSDKSYAGGALDIPAQYFSNYPI